MVTQMRIKLCPPHVSVSLVFYELFLRCCQKLLIKLYGKFAESVLRPATPTLAPINFLHTRLPKYSQIKNSSPHIAAAMFLRCINFGKTNFVQISLIRQLFILTHSGFLRKFDLKTWQMVGYVQ